LYFQHFCNLGVQFVLLARWPSVPGILVCFYNFSQTIFQFIKNFQIDALARWPIGLLARWPTDFIL
jgi:hypothetical protein